MLPPHSIKNEKHETKIKNDFRHEIWCLKGELVPVRFLSCSHIHNMMIMIKKDLESNPKNKWSGKKGIEWLNILSKELDYRQQVAESVFSIFPNFYRDYKNILQKKFKV